MCKLKENLDYTGICLTPGWKAFINRKSKVVSFAIFTSCLTELQIGGLHASLVLAISLLAGEMTKEVTILEEVKATGRREGVECRSIQPGYTESAELSSSNGNSVCHKNHFQLL